MIYRNSIWQLLARNQSNEIDIEIVITLFLHASNDLQTLQANRVRLCYNNSPASWESVIEMSEDIVKERGDGRGRASNGPRGEG